MIAGRNAGDATKSYLLLATLFGCGPGAEPEVEDWMLGTFSWDLPGDYLPETRHGIRQIFSADLTAETQSVEEAEARTSSEYQWRPVDASKFRYYGEGQDPDDADRWTEVRRTDDCAVLDVEQFTLSSGYTATVTHLYRGVICYEDISEPCPPEEAECGVVGRLYWCEEPEPCDDE